MQRPPDDKDEDFWGRPSAAQKLEMERQFRRELDAKAWQRNLVGALIVLALALSAVAFWR